jgi:hypothetical protein
MAQQVLGGAASEYRIGAATAAKIRSWPLVRDAPSAAHAGAESAAELSLVPGGLRG